MQNLIGILLPALIDLINSRVADTRLRFWVSVLVCSAVGTAVHFIVNGTFTGVEALSQDILAMFGVAQITYKAVWENAPLRENMGLDARKNGTE